RPRSSPDHPEDRLMTRRHYYGRWSGLPIATLWEGKRLLAQVYCTAMRADGAFHKEESSLRALQPPERAAGGPYGVRIQPRLNVDDDAACGNLRREIYCRSFKKFVMRYCQN